MAVATRSAAALTAELNDLLQLDHDAVQAYTLAIKELDNHDYQSTVRRFRGDHERHIRELTHLIRDYGGTPVDLPHIPTGVFKLAVQAVGGVGGDRAVLLAFKANERQVRDKYQLATERRHPDDVRDVLRRAADDEARHYAWALETLDDLGAGPRTMMGRTAGMLERQHARTANVIEGAERGAMEGVDRVRRSWRGMKASPPPAAVGGVAALAVAGVLTWMLVRRRAA